MPWVFSSFSYLEACTLEDKMGQPNDDGFFWIFWWFLFCWRATLSLSWQAKRKKEKYFLFWRRGLLGGNNVKYYSVNSELVCCWLQNNVNGRSLLRMNSAALERMGILDPVHRQEVWREIIKLKLKSDVLEIRDLEGKVLSRKWIRWKSSRDWIR